MSLSVWEVIGGFRFKVSVGINWYIGRFGLLNCRLLTKGLELNFFRVRFGPWVSACVLILSPRSCLWRWSAVSIQYLHYNLGRVEDSNSTWHLVKYLSASTSDCSSRMVLLRIIYFWRSFFNFFWRKLRIIYSWGFVWLGGVWLTLRRLGIESAEICLIVSSMIFLAFTSNGCETVEHILEVKQKVNYWVQRDVRYVIRAWTKHQRQGPRWNSSAQNAEKNGRANQLSYQRWVTAVQQALLSSAYFTSPFSTCCATVRTDASGTRPSNLFSDNTGILQFTAVRSNCPENPCYHNFSQWKAYSRRVPGVRTCT